MIFQKTTVHKLRVEFEDLDAGGVVHHPNYLRFIERARTAAMREQGYSFQQSMNDGFLFVVAEAQAKYLRAAIYEQELFVLSRILAVKRASLKIIQTIVSSCPSPDELQQFDLTSVPTSLFVAHLRLACVGLNLKPQALSPELKKTFQIPEESYFVKNPEHAKTMLGN